MDPQLPQPSSMELPAPDPEQVKGGPPPAEGLGGGTDSSEHQLSRIAEQPGSGMMTDHSLSSSASGTSSIPPVAADPALTVPPAGGAINPAMADDGDLIEKEWVLKAKHIVEKTKHDPHEQNKAVNRVKADYLKKRYKKDIKLTDE